MADPEPLPAEVQSDLDKLDDINKKQQEQIMSLETKAIQHINLYFVFQGVILSSITSTSPVKCHYWWIPFCLSLFAALFNFISVFDTISYFLKCSEELDQNYEDVQEMRQRRVTRAQLTNDNAQVGVTPPRPDTFQKWKRRFISWVAMVFLLGFSVIILYGCTKVLCDTREDKCVKLC